MINNKCYVLSMLTNICNKNEVLSITQNLVSKNQGAYVCVSNAHMCIEVLDSVEFKTVVNSADLVIPDGRSICWAQKLLGNKKVAQVRGQDIMHAICKNSGTNSLKIGLYGGSSANLLDVVVRKLILLYPDINISFIYSPPFHSLSEEEDQTIVNQINTAEVDILFVGIGCPKQEYWMAAHKDKLNCVMFGVGAAFDFISGAKMNAPRWMQYIGLEWLFRLSTEPRRLWKRYLVSAEKVFIF